MKPKAPPVLALLVAAALMWGVSAGLPGFAFAFTGDRLVAWAFLLAGVAVAASGVSSFARAGTTTDPLNPDRASALVTDGIYRYTRNPMYLGMASALLAWAFYLKNAAALLFVLAFVGFITKYQIKREEAALEKAFGDEYASYKASVRRWI